MRINQFNFVVAVFSSLGMLLAPAVQAAPVSSPRAVALQNDGVLLGQVVDAQGHAMAQVPVSVQAVGQQVVRAVTDKTGKFAVPNLKGGVYEVASVGHVDVYRLWAPHTAPPAAQHGLMLVSSNDLVRAQNCGSCVSCGSEVGCGSACCQGGGGVLGWMACHPIITAGAIGAAIAIPLAVDDDDPPATP